MLDTGTTIEGYRVEAILGEGCMGVVYRATDIASGRPVALKLMAAALSGDDAFRERFRREALLQGRLGHPHVVPVHAAGICEHGMYIAMPYLAGPNLKELIAAGDTRSPARLVELLAPVADALDAAHAAGLVHRDVKPQNVLLDEQGRPYLADFGSSRSAELPGLTATGQIVGTIDYMSPEQINSEPVDGRCDVYSLAIVVYECLTGEVPFVKPAAVAVVYAHLIEPPPPVTAKRPDLPAAVDAAVAAGMAKSRDERPASASALMQSVAAALGLPVAGEQAGAAGGVAP